MTIQVAVEIEQNIPFPGRTTRAVKPKYPFEKMAVGDSFKMPNEEGAPRDVIRRRANSAIANYHKRIGREGGGAEAVRFSALFVDDGVRVWRTA